MWYPGLTLRQCPRGLNGDATRAVDGGRSSDRGVSDSSMDSKCQGQTLNPDLMTLNP